MDKFLQLLLLSIITWEGSAQNFYSTYTNPYQNSFAFATPNLKQIFTTKLANSPQPQQQALNQQQPQLFAPQQSADLPNQQYSTNQLSNFYNAYYQQQQPQALAPQPLAQQQQQQPNYYVNEPQQYDDALFKQQYYNTQLQQQLQKGQLSYEQFQAPFTPSMKDTMASYPVEQQVQQQEQYKSLLGVAYSPSTKVSQVKFDSSKLKYDF